ncbi:MAG: HEAT repeat domain-containing protein [Treponemataceae bacterium]
MKKWVLIFVISLLSVTIAGAEETDPIATQNASRRDTIRYGTDAELLALIGVLENEENTSLDADLIALLKNAGGVKFVDAVFAYLTKGKKEGGENRALQILQNRDKEANSNIDSALQYLSSVKNKKASTALREILETEDARFSTAAARALGACGNEEDADYLVKYGKERTLTDALTAEIIYSLGEIKSKRATDFLTGILSNPDSKSSKKIGALEALGKIADQNSLEPILDSLRDLDANVRSYAVTALSSFSGNKTEKALIEAFRDSYYKVRIAAAKAAGERKLAEAIPYLKFRAERDEIVSVKEAALSALGSIGSGEALEIIFSLFSEKKTADRLRITSAKAMLEKAPDKYITAVIAAMEQAKAEKKMLLYHGLAKIISMTKTPNLEEQTRRFLSSNDTIDKMYGLDLTILNRYEGVKELVRALEKGANTALLRKIKLALGE